MSGEGGDPTRFIDKAVGACFAVLLGGMALYGAVQIIAAVFVPLCIGVAAVAGIVGIWVLVRRTRGF